MSESESTTYTVKKELLDSISAEHARNYRVLPVELVNQTTGFLSSSLSNESKNELEFLYGHSFSTVEIEPAELDALLDKHYQQTYENTSLESYEIKDNDNFIDQLIVESLRLKSSDIHIEKYENYARIRIRIDGKLIERYTVELEQYPYLLNKVKIKAGLDISEKRLPQDGRIAVRSTVSVDLRVSVLPTLHGEKIVLRILNKDSSNINMDEVISDAAALESIKLEILRPNGIILISGPTGSGKTTTLYSMLKELNKSDRNIVTIEDPVEYTLEGANQIQLKESIGLTFSNALRSILRQDPDIIMIGEIRDVETAQMAVRAALTGHLILSTIHTNSAWDTIARLRDMGVPSYLLSSTLNISIAQRLLRLLCPHCRQREEFNTSMYPPGFKPPSQVEFHFKSVGCKRCYHTGTMGRTAIYEFVTMTQEIKREVSKNELVPFSDLTNTYSLKTLSDKAFEVFIAGKVSIDEIYPYLLNF